MLTVGKDQNNFYLLLYGEKIKTQDFVDENGRKDAQHCKERAGACHHTHGPEKHFATRKKPDKGPHVP